MSPRRCRGAVFKRKERLRKLSCLVKRHGHREIHFGDNFVMGAGADRTV